MGDLGVLAVAIRDVGAALAAVWDALQSDAGWLLVLLIGLGSAIAHAADGAASWLTIAQARAPEATENERDLANGRLVLVITGLLMITLLVAAVAAIAMMWPPQPGRTLIVRWFSGVGIILWGLGMAWERWLRARVLVREQYRRQTGNHW